MVKAPARGPGFDPNCSALTVILGQGVLPTILSFFTKVWVPGKCIDNNDFIITAGPAGIAVVIMM